MSGSAAGQNASGTNAKLIEVVTVVHSDVSMTIFANKVKVHFRQRTSQRQRSPK